MFVELYTDDIVIMDRRYQVISCDEVLQQLNHLTFDQWQKTCSGPWSCKIGKSVIQLVYQQLLKMKNM